MFSPLQLQQMAMSDYEHAQSKARKRHLTALLLRRRTDLLSLDSILNCLSTNGQHSIGLVTVAVEKIIGTVNRNQDFDNEFWPRREATTMHRWISIVKAFYLGQHLPPIELRKVGEAYFVVDGHHRVSVARQQGQMFIDAYVTELDAREEELKKLGIAGA
jgi:hypothetical protein